MEKKMIWSRLKTLECPKCGDYISDVGDFYECNNSYIGDIRARDGCATALGCDFKISKVKFDEVVSSLYKPKQRSTEYQTADERLSELNNYGRERVSEDFSDSPFADRRP